jgi:hypothetical protein
MPALARKAEASCDSCAFIVADDPALSGVDARSESGTSFPEGGTSLEDVVMYHAADILCEGNTGLESECLQRRDVFRRHPCS